MLSWLISTSDFKMANSVTNTSKIFNQATKYMRNGFLPGKLYGTRMKLNSLSISAVFHVIDIFVCHVLPNPL